MTIKKPFQIDDGAIFGEALPRPDTGKIVADAMREFLHRSEAAAGIHKICDGAFFVTKPETMQALEAHFKEQGTFNGFKIMVPK